MPDKKPTKLVIKYLPIDEVIPWDKNPKKHHKEAIIESIKRFNVTKPILIRKGTHTIIAGRGRTEALKELGFKEVPVIELEMSDADAKAYAVIDNQTTIEYGWDDVMLDMVLKDIKIETPDLDLKLFGLEQPEPEDIVKLNHDEEWQGMPEFIMDDATGRKIVMHFKTDEAVDSFAKAIGQKITDKTKYLWYPKEPKISRREELMGDGDGDQ